MPKISALPGASTPLSGSELVSIVQGGVTKKVPASEIPAGVGVLPDQDENKIMGTAPGASGPPTPQDPNVQNFINGAVSAKAAPWATVAALQAVIDARAIGERATLAGKSAVGDGMQGAYNVVAKGGITANGIRRIVGTTRAAIRETEWGLPMCGASADPAENTGNLQALIDSLETTIDAPSAEPTSGKIIRVPSGNFTFSEPVLGKSGLRILGEGISTRFIEGAGFSGNGLFKLQDAGGGSGLFSGFELSNCSIKTTTAGIAAVRQNVGVVVNSRFGNLWLNSTEGLILDSYTQDLEIDAIYSYGPIGKILHLKGNHNHVSRIDKEGNTGTAAGPYILIENHALGNSTSNTLRAILIEGIGHADRYPIKLLGCDITHIYGMWPELTASNGYQIDIEDCVGTYFHGDIKTTSGTKIKVRTSTEVVIDSLSTNSEDVAWTSHFDVDTNSRIHVEHLTSRRGSKLRPVSDPRFTFGSHIAQIGAYGSSPEIGRDPRTIHRDLPAGNIFKNSVFRSGIYGWTVTSGAVTVTPTRETSETGLGSMLKLDYSAPGSASFFVTQSFAVSANQVGKPMVCSMKCKRVSADPTRVQIYVAGCGINGGSTPGAWGEISGAGAEDWYTVTAKFTPQSAGTLVAGAFVTLVATTGQVYLADACLGFGSESAPIVPYFASLVIGAGYNVIEFGTAAPTTGTWTVGDIVINTAATGPMFWKCTDATGSGTWVAQWSISSTLATYADEAAAIIGGIAAGTPYKTVTGELRVKL